MPVVRAINYPLLISIGLAIALHQFQDHQAQSQPTWTILTPWVQTR